MVDLDMPRLRIHQNFLKPFLKEKRTIETEGLDLADMLDGVVLLCQGEYKHRGTPFLPVKIHKNHAVYKKGIVSPLLGCSKMQFRCMKIPTPDMADEYMLNIPAAMMNLTRDLEEADMVDRQWSGKVGNVIVALPRLDVSTLMNLCIFSVKDLAQAYMFGYKALDPPNKSEFSNIGQARLSQVQKRKETARKKMLDRISIKNVENCEKKHAGLSSHERSKLMHEICSGGVFRSMQHKGEDKKGPTDPALLYIGWPFETQVEMCGDSQDSPLPGNV